VSFVCLGIRLSPGGFGRVAPSVRCRPSLIVHLIVLISGHKVVAISVGLPPNKEPPQTNWRVPEERYCPESQFPEMNPRGVRSGGIIEV
jgi:hypothetical protein